MNKYILKDGTSVEAIPIGKAKIKIGDINESGFLTICDRAPNKENSRKARVICKCKCGNYTIINAQGFYDGTTKSCGCYSQQLHSELCRELGKKSKTKDYSNKDNSYYSFIERTDKKDSNNSFYWIVECKNCGKRYKAVPSQLISETRRRGANPCDCWKNISKGVLKIKHILEKSGVSFIQEKTFDDCLSPKGNKLRFDFFLPDYNYLIEYDGEQHFKPTTFGDLKQSGEERLQLNQLYDNIKNDYCKQKNITLIRIPYSKYANLKLQDLIPQENE